MWRMESNFTGTSGLGQVVRVIVCRWTIPSPNYVVTNGFRHETETHIHELARADAGGVNADKGGQSHDNHDRRENSIRCPVRAGRALSA